jgi:phosphate:Na+ symporter
MVILGAGGVMPFSSAAFITLGSNVGSCFFVLLSSFNKNVQAKRSALFNLIFNLLGATLFFPILYFYSEQITALLINNNKGIGGAIADFHSAFNLICALVFFPFLSIFEKFIEKLVRVDDIKTKEKTFRDKRAFFN